MGGRGSWSETYTLEDRGMLSASQGGRLPSQKLNSSQFRSMFGNKANSKITAENAEKIIAENGYETGLIIDNDGFVLAAYKGHRGYVGFWDGHGNDDYAKLRGSIMTHNHPSGAAAFSPADIKVSANYGVKETRVVTKHNGTVSLKNKNHRADWDGFSKAYEQSFSSGMTAAQSRQWMRDNANQYNLTFTHTITR